MLRKPFVKVKGWLGRNANIKSLKRYCDEIWSELVKSRDNYKCILCEETKYIQAHHLISRKYLQTRFNINCGVTLCSGCHTFRLVSAHHSPWILYKWLKENKQEQYEWFLENRYNTNPEKSNLNINSYKEILNNLLEDFNKLSPQIKTKRNIQKSKYYRYSKDEEKQICEDYTKKLLSRHDLANKYCYSSQLISDILKRNNIELRKPGTRSKQFFELKKELN